MTKMWLQATTWGMLTFVCWGTPVLAADAPVERTGQTNVLFPADDGDLQAGVPLPTPRFTDNLDGTVTDRLTGLVWLKNANCFGFRTWVQGLIDAGMLASGQCGLSDDSVRGDWRLPNVKELQSLIHFGYVDPAISNLAGTDRWSGGAVCSGLGDAFPGLESAGYWASTTSAASSELAVRVRMNSGATVLIIKGTTELVWPVKGGYAGLPGYASAPVEQTGQISGFFPRDDGFLRAGLPLPQPRFTDNQDGTVTDRLTGLIWLRNANCLGQRTWYQAVASASALGSGSCGLTDGSAPGDWRLPNIKELQSLVNWAYANPALSNAAGTARLGEGDPFSLVQGDGYWSSTSKVDVPLTAWRLLMNVGATTLSPKDTVSPLWPVRGPY
jgi:hypothetical protein